MAVTRRPFGRAGHRRGIRWPVVGILALSGAKFADAVTTAVALTYLPLVELNPVVRALIGQVGIVPGLLLGSSAAIGFIILVTEAGVYLGGRCTSETAPADRIRWVGYGVPSVVFATAAAYNLGLMLLVL